MWSGYLEALVCTLVEALRRLALNATERAEEQVNTIRLLLFKIGALVRISARRLWLEMNSFYPWLHIYANRLQTQMPGLVQADAQPPA